MSPSKYSTNLSLISSSRFFGIAPFLLIYKWFNKAILKLPSRLNPNYQILLVGTTLHYDSLLQRCEGRSDFLSFNFPLVLAFPSNLEELTKDNVHSFKPKGFKLDDSSADIKDVLSDYLQDSASFYSEFQNLPLDKENAPLSTYTTYESLSTHIDSITIGIDPSMGKARGDYFALSTLYFSKMDISFMEAHKAIKSLLIKCLIRF